MLRPYAVAHLFDHVAAMTSMLRQSCQELVATLAGIIEGLCRQLGRSRDTKDGDFGSFHQPEKGSEL